MKQEYFQIHKKRLFHALMMCLIYIAIAAIAFSIFYLLSGQPIIIFVIAWNGAWSLRSYRLWVDKKYPKEEAE